MVNLALVVAAKAQQVDVLGPILKPLVPLLIIVGVIKVAASLIPKKRRRSRQQKVSNGRRTKWSRNRMSCPNCKDWISLEDAVCPHCGAPVDGSYGRAVEEKVKRTRRVHRKFDFLAKMIVTAFVGLAVSVCAIAVGSGMVMFVWICVGLLLIVLSSISYFVTYNKGKMGELLVMSRLRKGLPAGEYEILNNIYLPLGDGGTTQIDHVVVSRFGVFVVETKNYTGWIFADASSKVWTQTIYHEKNVFQNPIRQNYCHICAIADNLGLPKEYIRGVVAFTGDCEFKTPMPEGVVYSRGLADYIKSFVSPILKESEKDEILAVLREWDSSVTPEQRASHVENLRHRHNK